jgi:hypothetical protein
MVVVIGGHTRNIGKTSVVCGVIRALSDWNWTAIKITQYGHGICSRDGEVCDCSDPAHPIAVSQENGSSPSTDSGRFLASGATRSFWVRTPAGELNEAMPRIRRILAESDHTIIESNSILRLLKPDLCAMVLDGSVGDFKPSSLRFLDRANALVITSDAHLTWPEVPPALLRNKPRFLSPPPSYQNAAWIEAIRQTALKTSPISADYLHR